MSSYEDCSYIWRLNLTMPHWLASVHINLIGLEEFSMSEIQSIPLSALGITVKAGQITTVEKVLRVF